MKKIKNFTEMFFGIACATLMFACSEEPENSGTTSNQTPNANQNLNNGSQTQIQTASNTNPNLGNNFRNPGKTQDQQVGLQKTMVLDATQNAVEEIKKEFPGFQIPKSPVTYNKKNAMHLNNAAGLVEDKKIQHEDITVALDFGNGVKFFTIKKQFTMVDYQCDGYMDAGNTSGQGGGGLAGAFVTKFGDDNISKALGNKGVNYGDCKQVKIDWMNDHTKDKELFYAVGVQGAPTNRLVALGDNLLYITLDYLRHKYSGGANTHLTMEQIQTILGDNFDGFEKQVNCNYLTMKLASETAKTQGKTRANPYYLSMNPISTSIWGFDPTAAAYINLALMSYLSQTGVLQNMYINMWCYGKINNGSLKGQTEDVPYINAINALPKQA